MGKKFDVKFRTFPHSNSKRKLINRYEDDREEALQYTTNFRGLRNGGLHNRSCPDSYEDVLVYHKYITKPKKNDHKGQKSIRKCEVVDDEPES